MVNKILKDVKNLQGSEINKVILRRAKDFSSFKNKSNEEWFSELCYCILTANSKAKTALLVQKELGPKGFLTYSQNKLVKTIKKNKHRFHNNKAKYIVEARKYKNIKKIIQGIAQPNNYSSHSEAREFIVKNIKGLNYKESSHFLRNVGYFNLAILDRHIYNIMIKYKLIKEKPKSVTKKKYLEIEKKFNFFAHKAGIPTGVFDLYLWYIKTGEVLK
jgi:N-glycosylase/DNA lyase